MKWLKILDGSLMAACAAALFWLVSSVVSLAVKVEAQEKQIPTANEKLEAISGNVTDLKVMVGILNTKVERIERNQQ